MLNTHMWGFSVYVYSIPISTHIEKSFVTCCHGTLDGKSYIAKGASPYPRPERGQSKSKFLIDATNLWEKMQNNTHQYTRNEGKVCKQLI